MKTMISPSSKIQNYEPIRKFINAILKKQHLQRETSPWDVDFEEFLKGSKLI